MSVLKFECRRLFQGWVNKLSILLFVISGILSILIGANHYKVVKTDQIKSQIVFKKEREFVQKRDELPEMGSLAYYAYSPTEWSVTPWSALFNGQTSNQLVAMKVNALALQSQIHNREIINPNNTRNGGFDFGFVVIYILPILIGVLCVNLLADEQASGRWRLLSGFSKQTAHKAILRALLLRFVLIESIVIALFIAASLLLSIPFDLPWVLVLFAISGYILFWFAIVLSLMLLNKSARFNALSFISIWLSFAVLVPASIQLVTESNVRANQMAMDAVIKQRLTLNDGWDQDKQAALQNFAKQYPEYQGHLSFEGEFHWKWYYAMQLLSDLSVEQTWQQAQAFEQQNIHHVNNLVWLSPMTFMQAQLTAFAGTDRASLQHYKTRVAQYHQTVREFVYPYLFKDKILTNQDIDNFPLFETYVTKPTTPWFVALLWVFLSLIYLSLMTTKFLKTRFM